MIKNARNMNIMDCNCKMIMILEGHGIGKGISRTKFLKEGEKCNIPNLGKPQFVFVLKMAFQI